MASNECSACIVNGDDLGADSRIVSIRAEFKHVNGTQSVDSRSPAQLAPGIAPGDDEVCLKSANRFVREVQAFAVFGKPGEPPGPEIASASIQLPEGKRGIKRVLFVLIPPQGAGPALKSVDPGRRYH
jgi:hypothetical protein